MPAKLNRANRKFTEEQVRAIRADPRSAQIIATELCVTQDTIWKIRVRLTYRWVE